MKNMICGSIFDAKIEEFGMQNLVFRIILLAIYEVLVFREKASKVRVKRGPEMTPKSSFGRPGVNFCFLEVGKLRFLMNF